MIDYDTSQYPEGLIGWQALLSAIENASQGDESEWIEFKSNLDLRERTARPVLAKAIVAFANREVARAAEHFGGRGIIVIGLEPGALVGAPEMDPAELHDAVQPYLADPSPEWDILFVPYKDKSVLVVTVSAPQLGDPIHCIAKNGDKVRDGDVYVRNLGKSAPAKSTDMRALSTRLLSGIGTGLEIEVFVDVVDGVPQFDYSAEWVDGWVEAERRRLMAPLAPPTASKIDPRVRASGLRAPGVWGTILGDLPASSIRIGIAGSAANPMKIKHDEDRTEDTYKAEVEKYLALCGHQLPQALNALRESLSPLVSFQVRNLTESNFHSLEVNVHVEGDVNAFDNRKEFTNLRDFVPRPPRIWGPWTEDRWPVNAGLNFRHTFPSGTIVPKYELPGPTIQNGGSADITFLPIDLRPSASEGLGDGILLVAGPGLDRDITCTWSATAVNVDGRSKGTFTVPLREQRIDLSEHLIYEPPERGRHKDGARGMVVFPEGVSDNSSHSQAD